MSYTSVKSFKVKYDPKQLGHLSDDSGGDENIDDILTEFIDNAAGFIDTYLATRYTLPLSGTFPELARANLIVAWYDLQHRRPNPPDEVDPEYERIIEWLTMLKDGEVDLVGGSIRTDIAMKVDSETSIYTEAKYTD